MPSLGGFLLLLGLVTGAMLVQAAWRKRRFSARLRSNWGVAPARSLPVDSRASEAWRELRPALPDAAELDQRTWDDLDLDAVLGAIDRTHTALGQQMLYRWIRSGEPWSQSSHQEQMTEQFGKQPALREAVGLQLAGVGKSLGYGFWTIVRPQQVVTRWWYWSFPALTLAMLGSLAILPIFPKALVVAVGIAVLNMVVRTATAWQIPGLLTPMRQIGVLCRVTERLVQLEGVVPREIVDDLKQLRSLSLITGWVSRDPHTSGELLASLWEYLNLFFILDANALLLSARRLRRDSAHLTRLALWVGNLDAAWSVAALRAESPRWCIPTWSDGPKTRVAGIWHPLIAKPVGNDLELCTGNGMVITGANMSGKSTYLRSVGIAAVLARAINTCPADSWQGEAFRVRSLIGRNDNLALGKSYYQVEAEGVVAMLRDASEQLPTLFLLDELLRGTNTVERLAAGEAVLLALLADHAGSSRHAVVVATHDSELVVMLHDRYRPYHFRETIGPEGLAFDYQRREGPASSRTAIALLQATGAPPEVVAAAYQRAAELDSRDHP